MTAAVAALPFPPTSGAGAGAGTTARVVLGGSVGTGVGAGVVARGGVGCGAGGKVVVCTVLAGAGIGAGAGTGRDVVTGAGAGTGAGSGSAQSSLCTQAPATSGTGVGPGVGEAVRGAGVASGGGAGEGVSTALDLAHCGAGQVASCAGHHERYASSRHHWFSVQSSLRWQGAVASSVCRSAFAVRLCSCIMERPAAQASAAGLSAFAESSKVRARARGLNARGDGMLWALAKQGILCCKRLSVRRSVGRCPRRPA